MALIIPSHRRSRDAIVSHGGKYDRRRLYAAIDIDLPKDVLDYLRKVVPQCVVGESAAKVAKTPRDETVALEVLTKKDLLELAEDLGVEASATMKKAAIIDAILAAGDDEDE